MKKLLVVFMFILGVSAYADHVLDVNFKVEVGGMSSGFVTYNPDVLSEIPFGLFTDFATEVVLLDTVFVGASVKIPFLLTDWSNSQGIPSCTPAEMLYGFNAGLRIGNSLEIGVRHYCIHPAMTYAVVSDLSLRNVEGAFTEFYIQVKGTINIF